MTLIAEDTCVGLEVGGRLIGRRILITGAASGIGRATASLFADQDALIALSDVNESALLRAAQDLGAPALCLDLACLESVDQVVESSADRLGGLNGLVCCAGIGAVDRTEDMDLDTWNRVLLVNLTANFVLVKSALRFLRQTNESTIVLVASGMALLPDEPGRTAYAASKGGLVSYGKALAAELAPGVRVNIVCPGYTRTPLSATVGPQAVGRIALGRGADPGEIASAILYLTSAESSFVTGTTLVIDGGRAYH